jgi:hypothetical protein
MNAIFALRQLLERVEAIADYSGVLTLPTDNENTYLVSGDVSRKAVDDARQILYEFDAMSKKTG